MLVAVAAAAAETTPPRGDPAARLLPATGATEYWDVTAHLDGGYWLFSRFMITNQGLGTQTGVGMGSLVMPDGRVVEFSYARRKGEWKLSPDRLRIDVASSSLDLHQPAPEFGIDSNSRGIKVHLRLAPRGAAAWADAAGDGAYFVDALQVAAPVDGTLWVSGMGEPIAVRGSMALTHTWMNADEAALAQRRIEVFATVEDCALYLSDLTTPSGAHRRWLVVERDGRAVHSGSDFELTLGPATAASAASSYPIPDRLLVRDGPLTLEVRPERTVLRRDPLDGVPQPFRFLLSLRSRPQRIWAESSIDLSFSGGVEGAPPTLHGRGILAINFLNPLPHP